MRRVARAKALAACCLLWSAACALAGGAGCAASRSEPDAVGASCDASADCVASDAAEAQCGFVRLCIAGRCEAVDDAGVPASAAVRCGDASR